MSFRDDLRAWVFRQLRVLVNLSSSATVEDIRRLIEYPWIGEDLDPADRPMIPGSVGVGNRPPVTSTEPPENILEPGVLIWPETGATLPLTQNNSPVLNQYLSGPGTLIPVLDVYEYLLSEALQSATTCSSGAPRYTYQADSAPFLNSYLSRVYKTDQRYQELLADNDRLLPGLWTGLAQFLVQTYTGSGKKLSELVSGAGWTPDAKTDGLIRFWDDVALSYRYWYIRITALEGVQALELIPTGAGACPASWLNEHHIGTATFQDIDLPHLESWVLYSLQAQGSPVTLLDSVAMAPVWENGAEPAAHGWHFTWQLISNPVGGIIAEASICTLWEELVDPVSTHHHGKVHTVTFSLTASVLGASVAAGQSGTMHIENSVIGLYVPKDNVKVTLYFSQLNDPDLNSDSMPVYVTYDIAGNLIPLEYIKHYASTSREDNFLWEDTHHCVDRDEGWIAWCADEVGVVYRKDWRAEHAAGGGWRMGSVNATQKIGANGGTATETKTAQVQSLYPARACCTDPIPANQNPSPYGLCLENEQWCGGGALAEYEGHQANNYASNVWQHYLKAWVGYMTYKSDTYLANSWHAKGAVIPVDNANAVYIAQAIFREGYSRTNYEKSRDLGPRTPNCPGDPYCGGTNLGSAEFKLIYTNQKNPGDDPVEVEGAWWPSGLGSCEIGDTRRCGPYIEWTLLGSEDLLDEEMTAWLVTPHGTRNLNGDWATWLPFCGGDQADPERGWSGSVKESYLEGVGHYHPQPNEFAVVPDTLPGDPLIDFFTFSGAV